MQATLIVILIATILIGSLSRLRLRGWLFLFGLGSILIFTVIHLITHYNIIQSYEQLSSMDFFLIGISHMSYIGLFLFQYDFGDDEGMVVIEAIIGPIKWPWIGRFFLHVLVPSLIVNLTVAVWLLVRLTEIDADFTLKSLWGILTVLALIIVLPVGGYLLWVKFKERQKVLKKEALGEFQDLGRALRKIEKVKTLKLYRQPDSYIEIPPAVFSLSELEKLEIYYARIKEISKDISSLKKLRILRLHNNRITAIPDEIGELEQLEILDLNNNQLEEVNDCVCSCKNLIELSLSGHFDNIPPCLQNHQSLQTLVLQSSKISNLLEDLKGFEILQVLRVRSYENGGWDTARYEALKKALPKTKFK